MAQCPVRLRQIQSLKLTSEAQLLSSAKISYVELKFHTIHRLRFELNSSHKKAVRKRTLLSGHFRVLSQETVRLK